MDKMPVVDEMGHTLPRVLRPGVLIPVVCWAGMVGSSVAAVVLAVVAPEGGGHRFPAAGNWNALPSRLIPGLIFACLVWLFYKLASNRLILGNEYMSIVSVITCWKVARDEIIDVRIMPSSLAIILEDGCLVRPVMFWTTPAGAIYTSAGLFKNAMSRSAIRDQILSWRRQPAGPAASSSSRRRPCRRHWRLRLNLGLLALIVGVVAAEAVLVTALA